MSVGAYILEPKDLVFAGLYTPIATEKVFEQLWLPAVEELDLQFVKWFSLGIDVTKENLLEVKSELHMVTEWLDGKYEVDIRNFMTARIKNLEAMLDKAFALGAEIVFIG